MDYLNFLAPTIESLGGFGYWLIFLIAFSESFAFIGTLIPGSILIYLAGFLASQGYFSIINLIWFTTAGAILGDGSSYFLGTKGKHFFKNENKLLKLSHLEKGEEFFRKHGPKSVFIGRFVGPLRPIIPFVAGLSRMDKKTFFLWNISSAILWSVSHLLVGYFFGSAIDVIEAWMTRAGLVILSLAAFLFLIWLALKKSAPLIAFVKSSFIYLQTWLASGAIGRFAEKNPALAGFVAERFGRSRFSGMPLTLLLAGFVYVLFLFFGSVQNALSSGTIALADARVADLLFSFRDTALVIFFTWVSLLAKWQVIVALAVVATLILRLWRKEFYILPLWAVIGGSELFRYLGGLAFYRPRPESSVYFKIDPSFPNLHAVLAAAFYGFVVYMLARHSKTWGRTTNIIFAGLVITLGIGFSALYLGEGFLSDVWGGYLLGVLVLLFGISFAELLKTRESTAVEHAPAGNAGIFSAVLLASWLIFYAGFSLLLYHPVLRAAAEAGASVKVADAASIFDPFNGVQGRPERSRTGDSGKLPKFSEKLFGEKFQPLNFIIVARSEEELIDSMSHAGWLFADQVDIGTLLKLLRSEITGRDYPKAPMTPSFWNTGVNGFGFEKASSDVYSRRHLRIWKTNFETPDGGVYVGTVRLDSVKWIVIHKSSPYVDIERELLFSDLSAAGVVFESKKLQFTEQIAENGDLSDTPFFTDGKIYEVVLK